MVRRPGVRACVGVGLAWLRQRCVNLPTHPLHHAVSLAKRLLCLPRTPIAGMLGCWLLAAVLLGATGGAADGRPRLSSSPALNGHSELLQLALVGLATWEYAYHRPYHGQSVPAAGCCAVHAGGTHTQARLWRGAARARGSWEHEEQRAQIPPPPHTHCSLHKMSPPSCMVCCSGRPHHGCRMRAVDVHAGGRGEGLLGVAGQA